MCGIVGCVNLSLEPAKLTAVLSSLNKRGPDAQGFFVKGGTALGHRRLSIIDLSESANQPFTSKDGRWKMVFNGEIYNFQEIKKRLNIECFTSSDTEVLLEAFALKGPEVFAELNGFFAAAIWDTVKNELFLVRDRIGIKPLYLWRSGQSIAFASELKALNCLVGGGTELNHRALHAYLHLGFASSDSTFRPDISSFPKASYAVFSNGSLVVKPYWTLPGSYSPNHVSEERAVDQLQKLVESSVAYRMIADVPLGTFLSGGIDSSLVTAVAQSLSDKPVKTFSIGFKESKYDESRYAAQVAKSLGTDHHPFTVGLKRAQDLLDTVIGAYDEPFGDSSSIPTMLVSELAREHVTVALSGDGGDETHLGYGAYTWAKRLSSPLGKLEKLAAIPLSLLPQDRYRRASWMFKAPSKDLTAAHILSQEQYAFSLKELNTLLLEPPSAATVDQFRWNVSQDPTDNQSRFDLNYYLPDDLLVKVDRASMYHSLEVRVPLLDHRLVEFALSLPTSLRMKNGEHKYLLKEVLYRYLDPKLFDRPKWGFSIPIEYWIQHDWAELISAYLNEEAIKKTRILNPTAVTKLRDRFAKGETYLYKRIWLLFVLQKWLIDFRGK